MREKAIADYHSLLQSDPGLTAELFSRLKSAMSSAHLLYGERAIGVSLRPHFLNQWQYDLLAGRSQLLVATFDKAAEAMLADPSLMTKMGLTDRERRLSQVHPGYRHPTITTRLDAFVHGDEVKFVEYNAENPSSLPDQSGLNQVLFEVPALQTFAERYRLREFSPMASLFEALLATWEEWSGRARVPHVAILDWADLPTSHEFMLLRNYFASHGVPTIICTPEELEYADGRLRRGDFRIDLVYKRVIIHEFLSRCDEAHPLIQAYLKGDVCLINPFRCKMLHKKASFELLTGEEYQGWYSEAEKEVIRHSIPWTRRVVERKTIHRGEEIDLLPYLRANRAGFVLKPNDDYGGRGIFFGRSSTEAEWDERLQIALAGDYVAQELIALHTEEFPIFNENEWNLQPMYVDTNPFVFRNRVDGALIRLSDSPIVNVTSGGGETGFFILEDE